MLLLHLIFPSKLFSRGSCLNLTVQLSQTINTYNWMNSVRILIVKLAYMWFEMNMHPGIDFSGVDCDFTVIYNNNKPLLFKFFFLFLRSIFNRHHSSFSHSPLFPSGQSRHSKRYYTLTQGSHGQRRSIYAWVSCSKSTLTMSQA